MPFEIKFFGEDPAQTLREVQALLKVGFAIEVDKGAIVATAPVAEGKPARAPRKAAEPKQLDIEEAIVGANVQVMASDLNDDISDLHADVEDDTAEEAAPAPVYSKDDVRQKLMNLLKAKGDDSVPKLLKKFKAGKIGELKESQYAEVVAAAEAALQAD